MDSDNADLSGPPYHVVSFKNEMRFVLNVDDPVFDNDIVDHLASLFSSSDFSQQSVIMIKSLIKSLLEKFNDSDHNMAYFTGCVVSVFCKVAETASYSSSVIKAKLLVFIGVVGDFIKHLDHELYEKWFVCHGEFNDWVLLLASVFMPNRYFVRASDRIVIINAIKYLTSMVKSQRYVFHESLQETLEPSESSAEPSLKFPSKRKLNDIGCVKSEAKRITRNTSSK